MEVAYLGGFMDRVPEQHREFAERAAAARLVDPMPTFENLSAETGVPVDELVHYALVRWVSAGSEALMAIEPQVLDELPNLVNVLKGDMAIIGPRPTIPVQVEQYTDRQRGRLAVRPGITGWAQVNGRTSLPWSERIELDLWYIEHRSLRLDLQILLRTAAIVFGGEGLYKGDTGGWRGQ